MANGRTLLRDFRTRGGGLATKLYSFAFMSIMAVAALAAASIYFSNATERAAKILYGDGFIGITDAARLEQLLGDHRRIVESWPAEVDRQRIGREKKELDQIQTELSALTSQIVDRKRADAPDAVENRIEASLPELFAEAEKVAFYAHEFAQDKASERVQLYSRNAEQIQLWVGTYRNLRMDEAREAIASVSKTASSLTLWVLVCVGIACILIGPIGLTTVHNMLLRLTRITEAMARLAAHDTTTVVPSRQDTDEVGNMARAVEVFKDNAVKLMAREIELKQLNRRIDVALNNMTHGLCMFDAEHRLIVCNSRYIQMYGLLPELVQPGTPLQAINDHRTLMGTSTLMNTEQSPVTAAAPNCPSPPFAQVLADGRIIAVSEKPMIDGGWVAVHEDVTERQLSEAKIAHLAHHDVLTDLPNRVLFMQHLERAVGEARQKLGCAVYCLDLDGFKHVNDTFGHSVGDQLLKAVAARLLAAVPKSAFVARVGGDEFVIVQMRIKSRDQCSPIASSIVETLSAPFDIKGRHIVIGVSIGITLTPDDGVDLEQLLRNADIALYQAKSDGRGVHRFFEYDMDTRLQDRRSLELDLHKAIGNAEFELYYQPIVALQSRQVTGFEALIRWNHPERGQISPDQFIPIAEETGLILPLGEWVLRTACLHAANWPKDLCVAVNLSATQFKGRQLVQLAMNALASSGMAPNRLDLEITETVLLQDEANTLALLHQLREIGIQISLDDFGTGYSSLAYVRKFPFDKIKIDRSFVQDMLVREDCRAIVRAVISLAKGLGITTIVEGVESPEQVDAAIADGCSEGQGYLFARPMPIWEVAEFLTKQRAVRAA